MAENNSSPQGRGSAVIMTASENGFYTENSSTNNWAWSNKNLSTGSCWKWWAL